MKLTTIRFGLTNSIAVALAAISIPGAVAGDSVAMASGANLMAIGRDDGSIELRAISGFQLEATLNHLDEPANPASAVVHTPNLTFSPDGKLLASAVGASGVVLWDVARREKLRTLPTPSVGYDLTFSGDGSRLAGIGIDSKAGPHRFTLWDTGSGEVVKTLTLGLNQSSDRSASRFVCAVFDGIKGTLAVGSVEEGEPVLRLLDPKTGDVVVGPTVGRVGPDPARERGESPDLKDGSYTLSVTHLTRHPPIQFPDSRIADEAFKPAEKAEKLQIRLSDGGEKVEIFAGVVSGKVEKRDGAVRSYRLDKGLFAGGQFTVEPSAGRMIATFTQFGSGVPVIQSQRGELSPDE